MEVDLNYSLYYNKIIIGANSVPYVKALGPRIRVDSIKTKEKKRDEIFKIALYLEAGPIPLEVDCKTSNEFDLLKKYIFYKKKLYWNLTLTPRSRIGIPFLVHPIQRAHAMSNHVFLQ